MFYSTRPVLVLASFAFSALAATAQAEMVRVTVNGTVEFNAIGGNQAGVLPGDPVSMAFTVDSDNFLDSPDFPTRGYALDLSTFAMTVGSAPLSIVAPQPNGATAYFVLRNNDPAVDGFFLSTDVELPQPVSVNIPGLAPVHELNFMRTFGDGTPLASLNILDALGTYGTENLEEFDWSVGLFGNAGALYTYESITLAAVPEPSSLTLVGCVGAAGAGVGGWWRRRRRTAQTTRLAEHRAGCCRRAPDTPVPCRLLRFDQLAVVLEDNAAGSAG